MGSGKSRKEIKEYKVEKLNLPHKPRPRVSFAMCIGNKIAYIFGGAIGSTLSNDMLFIDCM